MPEIKPAHVGQQSDGILLSIFRVIFTAEWSFCLKLGILCKSSQVPFLSQHMVFFTFIALFSQHVLTFNQLLKG